MKILKVISKKHGLFSVKLDNEDYVKATKNWRTRKWCVRVCKGRDRLFYFQKRLPNQKLIELHRFVINAQKGQIVDHINRDTLDNRKANLRICTNSENLLKGKVRTNNKSGQSGVWQSKRDNKWKAEIKINYKKISLGSYKRKRDAIKARKNYEKSIQQQLSDNTKVQRTA